MYITQASRQPLGYQQLALSATVAGGLTVPDGANYARIVPNAAIRYRDDGTDPTSSVGLPVTANTAFDYSGKLSALRLISASAVTIDCLFYRG